MKDDLLHEKVTLLVDFINKSDQELREMNIYETLKHLRDVKEHSEKFGLKLNYINHQKLLDAIVLLELAERYKILLINFFKKRLNFFLLQLQ